MGAIEPIQFGSGVLGPEPPVDGAARGMAFSLIGVDGLLQGNLLGVASLETGSGVPVPHSEMLPQCQHLGSPSTALPQINVIDIRSHRALLVDPAHEM